MITVVRMPGYVSRLPKSRVIVAIRSHRRRKDFAIDEHWQSLVDWADDAHPGSRANSSPYQHAKARLHTGPPTAPTQPPLIVIRLFPSRRQRCGTGRIWRDRIQRPAKAPSYSPTTTRLLPPKL